MPPEPPSIGRYRAFLSYSHGDKRAAKRWHHRLETFTVNPILVGTVTAVGPVPETLSPICRDEIDLAAGGELKPEIAAKLDRSAALIVMASPRAVKSPYVNEEIRYFRHTYPDRPVCAIIVSGRPGDPRRECRPLMLRRRLAADGQPTDEPIETLLANPHWTAEGPSRAMAKVVAALTGLDVSAVEDRVREHVRRDLLRHIVPLVVLGLVMLLGGGLLAQWGTGRFDSVDKGLSELRVGQDRMEDRLLAAIAREKGVPLPTLREILSAFGYLEEASDPARVEKVLRAKADDYIALQDRLNRLISDDPLVQDLRQQAASALSMGQFAAADGALAQAEARDLEVVEELESHAARRRLSAAQSRAERGAAARLRLDYRTAAQHYAEAARLVPAEDTVMRWHYTIGQGFALYEGGRDFGDNPALRETIATFQAALGLAQRDRIPMDWAATQNYLGSALATLGERESGTARLEEAVAAFRAALEEWTRDRVPLDWAGAQNNLGNALVALGARESRAPASAGAGRRRLEEALAAHLAALEEWTRDRVPLGWAWAQRALGNALGALGRLESETPASAGAGRQRLEEAVAAYRAALEESPRDSVPLAWAVTQEGLGLTLSLLGDRHRETPAVAEEGRLRLEEALAVHRAALEESPRDRVPLEWAARQAALGSALAILGEWETGTVRLEEALTVFRAALEEQTRDRVPMAWAVTQMNLGAVLWRLAARSGNNSLLDDAAVSFKAALEECHAESVPFPCSTARLSYQYVLALIRTRDSPFNQLHEQVDALRVVLSARSRDNTPLEWANAQSDLAITVAVVGERFASPGHLDEAIARMEGAAEVYREHHVPDMLPLLEQRVAKLKVMRAKWPD